MDRQRTFAPLLALFLGLWAAACQPSAPPAPDAAAPLERQAALMEAVDAAIEAEMQDNHLPGVGLVLVHQGEILYMRGYGLANVETGAIMDPDRTIVRVGSISKALTLLALARQVDAGELSRTDDVSAFHAGTGDESGFSAPVTVDNLLTHTTGFDQIGLGRQITDFDQPLAERLASPRDLSAFLAGGNLRRVSPAGGYFRYDTYGPTLAGVILEQLTGDAYPDAMAREMFEPLGMERTSVEVAPEHLSDLASGHGYIDGAYVRTPYEIYRTTPASSIDSTVADMGRLLEALTSDGANAYGRFVGAEMAAAILAPQYRPHPGFAGMTHGLWESFGLGRGADAIPVRTIGHGGDMWGFNASLTLIPEFDLGFFVVANRNGEGGGPGVSIGRPVLRAIMAVLDPDRAAAPAVVPDPDPGQDLSEYAGDYVWGVYCHSCSAAEFGAGAWPQPRSFPVTAGRGVLRIHEAVFIPRGGDVFVRADGYDQVAFRRDESGSVTAFSHQEDPTAYERLR